MPPSLKALDPCKLPRSYAVNNIFVLITISVNITDAQCLRLTQLLERFAAKNALKLIHSKQSGYPGQQLNGTPLNQMTMQQMFKLMLDGVRLMLPVPPVF